MMEDVYLFTMYVNSMVPETLASTTETVRTSLLTDKYVFQSDNGSKSIKRRHELIDIDVLEPFMYDHTEYYVRPVFFYGVTDAEPDAWNFYKRQVSSSNVFSLEQGQLLRTIVTSGRYCIKRRAFGRPLVTPYKCKKLLVKDVHIYSNQIPCYNGFFNMDTGSYETPNERLSYTLNSNKKVVVIPVFTEDCIPQLQSLDTECPETTSSLVILDDDHILLEGKPSIPCLADLSCSAIAKFPGRVYMSRSEYARQMTISSKKMTSILKVMKDTNTLPAAVTTPSSTEYISRQFVKRTLHRFPEAQVPFELITWFIVIWDDIMTLLGNQQTYANHIFYTYHSSSTQPCPNDVKHIASFIASPYLHPSIQYECVMKSTYPLVWLLVSPFKFKYQQLPDVSNEEAAIADFLEVPALLDYTGPLTPNYLTDIFQRRSNISKQSLVGHCERHFASSDMTVAERGGFGSFPAGTMRKDFFMEQLRSPLKCVICYTTDNCLLSLCGHVVCKDCQAQLQQSQSEQCPTCRSTLSPFDWITPAPTEHYLPPQFPSIVQRLRYIYSKTQSWLNVILVPTVRQMDNLEAWFTQLSHIPVEKVGGFLEYVPSKNPKVHIMLPSSVISNEGLSTCKIMVTVLPGVSSASLRPALKRLQSYAAKKSQVIFFNDIVYASLLAK